MNTKRRFRNYWKKFRKKTQKFFIFLYFPIFSSLILGKYLKRSGRGWVIFSHLILFFLCITTGVYASTGDTVSGSGVTEEITQILEVPDFKITFQNPSYVLERDEERSDYTCDSSKSECKVNFKLQTLDDKDISSGFICSINFSFESSESSKCNPNTVMFPEGNTSVVFRISDKNDATNFKEKTVLIKKEASQNQEDTSTGSLESSSGSIDSNTGTIDTASGAISQSGSLDSGTGVLLFQIPDPSIEVQSGLEYSGTGNLWNCKKEDCRVNLTAENIFTGSFIESDYKCQWDFGGGTFTTANTDTKCNPGYVNYHTGTFNILLTVTHEQNPSLIHTGSLFVQNILESHHDSENGNIPTPAPGGGGGSSLPILPEIVLQSGGDGNNTCNQERCKINLLYEATSSQTCQWDFGDAEFKEKYLSTCNPGFIYLHSGMHTIGVKIFQSGVLRGEKTIVFENVFLKNKKQNNLPPRAHITLQGKLSDKKFLVENGVVCRDVTKCYINLTGDESHDPNGDRITFSWNLGNGVVFDKENPKGVWYGVGKQSVFLKVTDILGSTHESSFSIEVIPKPGQQKETPLPDQDDIIEERVLRDISYFKNLKIHSALVNPKGRDNDAEYIRLENTGFAPINLNGIILDDIREKGSKPFVIREDIILGAFESKPFYRDITKIALNNTQDGIHLIYSDELLDSFSWQFSVPEDYVLSKKDTEFLEYQIKVLRAIDGDTLLIEFPDGKVEKLRLVGVDTPETKHPKKAVEFFGKEASDFTKKMLEGKEVILRQSLKNYRDKYRRLLGYIYIPPFHLEIEGGDEVIFKEEIFFNKLLIEHGYARAYLRFPFEYSIDFKKAENKAKREKLGMWADTGIKKEIAQLVKDEKKLANEEVPQVYRKRISLKDIQIGEAFSIVTDQKQNLENALKQNISETYISFSQLWSQEKAKERKKELKNKKTKQKKIVTQTTPKKRISFTKTVTKQKKSLKISGKTLPNKKIIISGMQDDIILYSDDAGKYETKIHTGLVSGDYNLSFFVEDEDGELFAINRDKEITLEEEYLENMKKYYLPKVTKTASAKKTLKTKKDISDEKISSGIEEKETIGEETQTTFIANIVTICIVIVLAFALLRREKII